MTENSNDIMKDLQPLLDYLKSMPIYEVWINEYITGDNGLIIDCQKTGILPVLPHSTHIMAIPEMMLEELRQYIIAGDVPVFAKGKRIL